jgi:hypothetical protein
MTYEKEKMEKAARGEPDPERLDIPLGRESHLI